MYQYWFLLYLELKDVAPEHARWLRARGLGIDVVIRWEQAGVKIPDAAKRYARTSIDDWKKGPRQPWCRISLADAI